MGCSESAAGKGSMWSQSKFAACQTGSGRGTGGGLIVLSGEGGREKVCIYSLAIQNFQNPENAAIYSTKSTLVGIPTRTFELRQFPRQ
eukprot:2423513-Rhodomonas_salina.3